MLGAEGGEGGSKNGSPPPPPPPDQSTHGVGVGLCVCVCIALGCGRYATNDNLIKMVVANKIDKVHARLWFFARVSSIFASNAILHRDTDVRRHCLLTCTLRVALWLSSASLAGT